MIGGIQLFAFLNQPKRLRYPCCQQAQTGTREGLHLLFWYIWFSCCSFQKQPDE